MISKIRGTRDILDTKIQRFVEGVIGKVLKDHSFSEIILPTIENVSLFQRSLGGETEVITKEMYLVSTIHDNEVSEKKELICLRPEATAQIMRAYLENNITKNPWRVYTNGSLFRHERPQRGRYREFYSFSIEMIAAKSFVYDVELIYILNKIFKTLKVDDFILEINFLGDLEDRKIYLEALNCFVLENKDNFSEYALLLAEKNPLRLFDLKDEGVKEIMKRAPIVTDFLSHYSQSSWLKIQSLLKSCNINYTINSSLVRGLDYYSDIVFEFKHQNLGSQNTFCGGGRYNGLAKALGSTDIVTSVGAGIGIDRLLLILENINGIDEKKNFMIGIICCCEEYYNYAFQITMLLIDSGLKAEFYCDKSSFKSGMRKASSDGADFVCLIGEEEYQEKLISVKNLKTGDQIKVLYNDIVAHFNSLLN